MKYFLYVIPKYSSCTMAAGDWRIHVNIAMSNDYINMFFFAKESCCVRDTQYLT